MENILRLPTTSGVYAIVCRCDNGIYVGESLNVQKRWKQHKKDLLNNKHDNYKMPNAYNKYGEESFDYYLLQQLVLDTPFITKLGLIMVEDAYIKEYSKKYNIYNITDTIQNYLIGKPNSFSADPNSKHSIILRKNLVDMLLSYEIEWIDGVPCLFKSNTIDSFFSKKSSQNKIIKIIEDIPEEIFKECVRKKEVSYIGVTGEMRKKVNLIIQKEQPLLSWLIKNKYVSKNNIQDVYKNEYGIILNKLEN